MSLWKKIGIGLVAAVALVIVALAVAVLVPGGWKFSLILLGVPGAGRAGSSGRGSGSPIRRPAATTARLPAPAGDERTERWRHPSQ
ncbi:hypothetical protein GCM10020219_033630 [Nonomuraea dietziae]